MYSGNTWIASARAHRRELAGDLHRKRIRQAWEEGEDPSLLEFKTIQYSRKGHAIPTDEQLARIAKVPKREFMRRDINQHTLEKICAREPVRAIKLEKCLRVLEEYEVASASGSSGGDLCGNLSD